MAGLAKTYRSNGKLSVGVCGWKCRCCNPFRTDSRKAKTKLRRRNRRTIKDQEVD